MSNSVRHSKVGREDANTADIRNNPHCRAVSTDSAVGRKNDAEASAIGGSELDPLEKIVRSGGRELRG